MQIAKHTLTKMVSTHRGFAKVATNLWNTMEIIRIASIIEICATSRHAEPHAGQDATLWTAKWNDGLHQDVTILLQQHGTR